MVRREANPRLDEYRGSLLLCEKENQQKASFIRSLVSPLIHTDVKERTVQSRISVFERSRRGHIFAEPSVPTPSKISIDLSLHVLLQD